MTHAPERHRAIRRLAEEWSIPFEDAELILALAHSAYIANTHATNGAAHPRYRHHAEDKHRNAIAWCRIVDECTRRLKNLTGRYGFTDVVYTGLGPTLKRRHAHIDLPYLFPHSNGTRVEAIRPECCMRAQRGDWEEQAGGTLHCPECGAHVASFRQ